MNDKEFRDFLTLFQNETLKAKAARQEQAEKSNEEAALNDLEKILAAL